MTASVQDVGLLEEYDMRRLDPPYDVPGYRSTTLRAPTHPLLVLPPSEADTAGPVFGEGTVGPNDHDLTHGHPDEPMGQRITVEGQLLDITGRPIARQLIEVWQANAAGRYAHDTDRHDAPLDPSFAGAGRCLTDDEGRYRFVTVKPGEYPWRNHPNAWRPAHIHFSLFGTSFTSRLVTQMYLPGDPLLEFDPMYQSIADRRAAERLVARFDLEASVESWALGYRFDVVLGGATDTPIQP